MTTAGELRSGKGHRDENFPVASVLIDARHRGIILAFYEFVRVADDIADTLPFMRWRLGRWPSSSAMFSKADGSTARSGSMTAAAPKLSRVRAC